MSEQDSRPTGAGHLPASEDGTGIGETGGNGDTSKPESESEALGGKEVGGEPQSWPGKSFGSIPPPG